MDKLFSASIARDGFILVGLTDSVSDDSNAWVVKINGNGQIVWNKIYGGAMEDVERAVVLAEDKHFIIAGYTNSMGNGDYDFMLLKIDDSSNLLWNKTYGRQKATRLTQ